MASIPEAQASLSPVQHPELYNLAQDLDEKELSEIANRVIQDYETDEDSRADWLKTHAHWIDLYYQRDVPKQPPWPGSSEESVPMMAEACNQFHARAMRAFFPNRNVIQAIPAGSVDPDSTQRAERIGKHMSWQLMVKDKSYKKNKDALLLSVSVHGSFFTKTYYHPIQKRNIVENVRAEDLVVPYGVGPRDLKDIDRKTQIIYESVNQTKILVSKGYFVNPGTPYQQQDDRETTEAADRAEGLKDDGMLRDRDRPCKILEQHRLLDLDGDDIFEPYIVTVDAQSRKVMRISIRYDVDEIGNPTKDKEPVEYFDHWVFLPNPDGFYGLGMGHLIGRINTAVNKMLRQTVDAGTLANIGNASGFIAESLSGPKGQVQFQLGKFLPIPANASEVKDGVYQFKFPGPNASIVSIAELLMGRGDRLATTTEMVSGETDKVLQPTVVLALLEQSQQVFSTVYERLFMTWESELEKIYRLNGKYLDEEEYFTVLDLKGPEQLNIARADYKPDMQVIPIADPKMSTEKQKLAKAQQEYQFALTNPLVQINPAAILAASRHYADQIEMDPKLKNELFPVPADPMRMDDPNMENMAGLFPKSLMPPVHMDQNHLEHIKSHEMFMKGPYAQVMTPEDMLDIQNHIRMHYAMMYGLTETNMPQMIDPMAAMMGVLNGGRQAGTNLMGPMPGGQMGMGGPGQEVPPAMGAMPVPGGAGKAQGPSGSLALPQ